MDFALPRFQGNCTSTPHCQIIVYRIFPIKELLTPNFTL
jgi:hypothetical protein